MPAVARGSAILVAATTTSRSPCSGSGYARSYVTPSSAAGARVNRYTATHNGAKLVVVSGSVVIMAGAIGYPFGMAFAFGPFTLSDAQHMVDAFTGPRTREGLTVHSSVPVG